MDITPVAAATYSMNKGTEFAYELTYDLPRYSAYKVRTVVQEDGMFRLECNTDGKGWKANKPYTVKKDKKRQGDRVVEKVKAFLAD